MMYSFRSVYSLFLLLAWTVRVQGKYFLSLQITTYNDFLFRGLITLSVSEMESTLVREKVVVINLRGQGVTDNLAEWDLVFFVRKKLLSINVQERNNFTS